MPKLEISATKAKQNLSATKTIARSRLYKTAKQSISNLCNMLSE